MADEEWRSWIGKEGPVIYPPYEVCKTSIGFFLEVTENANPLFWDEEYAKTTEYGGVVAPPTMAFVSCFGPTWHPDPSVVTGPPALLGSQIPLDTTGGLNAGTESFYLAPIRPGDKIHYQSKLTEINPRTTRLGNGFFITEEMSVWNQRNEKVAVLKNTMFRYKREA